MATKKKTPRKISAAKKQALAAAKFAEEFRAEQLRIKEFNAASARECVKCTEKHVRSRHAQLLKDSKRTDLVSHDSGTRVPFKLPAPPPVEEMLAAVGIEVSE